MITANYTKCPIFITGYERSGTTLLRRLVSMHPLLMGDIVHEKRNIFLKYNTKEDLVKNLTFRTTQQSKPIGNSFSSILVGQKIPYLKFNDFITLTEKFFNIFPEAYMIHIIRNPTDTISSQIKTFNKNEEVCIENWFSSVPDVIDYIHKHYISKTLLVNYDEIMKDAKSFIYDLYRWIEIGKNISDIELERHINKVMKNKNPWDGPRKRTMCGLRYFSDIKKITQPCKITFSGQKKIAKKLKELKM